MRRQLHHTERGAALPELMITALIVGVFFASIFEVNAVCLRYVNASKESVAAIQAVQDRLETLRNLAYSDLTDQNYVKTLMAMPADAAELAKKATETVTITAYDTDSSPGGATASRIVIFRPAGTTSSPVFVGTPDPTVATAAAVLVEVQYDWTMSLGGRTRSEKTASIVANGTKK